MLFTRRESFKSSNYNFARELDQLHFLWKDLAQVKIETWFSAGGGPQLGLRNWGAEH